MSEHVLKTTNNQSSQAFDVAQRYLKHNKRMSTSKYGPVTNSTNSPGNRSPQNHGGPSPNQVDPKFFQLSSLDFQKKNPSRSKEKIKTAALFNQTTTNFFAQQTISQRSFIHDSLSPSARAPKDLSPNPR